MLKHDSTLLGNSCKTIVFNFVKISQTDGIIKEKSCGANNKHFTEIDFKLSREKEILSKTKERCYDDKMEFYMIEKMFN